MEKAKRFVELVYMHKGLIYSVCAKYHDNEHDIQDLFQDILLAAWKSFEKFKGDSTFSTWLYSVARNTASVLARKRRISTVPIEGIDIANMCDTSEPYFEFNLEKEIERLPGTDRRIAKLYADGKGYRVMSDLTGITQNALRVRMNRIKRKLRYNATQLSNPIFL